MTVIPQDKIDPSLSNYDADDIQTIQDFTGRLIKQYAKRTKAQKRMDPTFHIMAGAPGAGKTKLGQEMSQETGIPAFDFDTVLAEFYADQGIQPMYSGMDEYMQWRDGSLYMANTLVNAMAAKKLSFIFSIASSNKGVLYLMDGMKEAGYNIVSHLCDADQGTCHAAVSIRAMDGDRHVTEEDMRQKPQQARQNFLPMIERSAAAHVYWRTDARSGLSEIMRLSERKGEILDSRSLHDFNRIGKYEHQGVHHSQSFELEAIHRHEIGYDIFKGLKAK